MADFRKSLSERVLLADGAVGTLLEDRLAGPVANKSLQNLLHPEAVLQIHREYLQAGADVLTTNSFDANPVKLKGEAPRLEEILRRAARLALQARAEEARPGALVAGSIGPLGMLLKPYGAFTYEEMAEAFGAIARALAGEGVDLILFETFSSLLELEAAVAAVRSFTDLPVVGSMTFSSDGLSRLGDEFEKSMAAILAAGADACGINCFLGPKDSYELVEPLLRKSPLPFSLMPNAGLPAIVNRRTFYLSNPGYFQEYALNFARLGVGLIGSCCGTTPAHTAAMRRALDSPGRARPAPAPAPAPERRPPPDNFRRRLGREFVVTLEVPPPKGLSYGESLQRIRELTAAGVDAIDVTENPLAKIRMSPAAFSRIVIEETGAEPILHFTLRDRNLLAIQSDLLGAWALGIRTVFALRGDPAVMGDFPEATTVYDIDTLGLIKVIGNLNRGIDISNKPMKSRTGFLIGAAANPMAADLEQEIVRVGEKVAAGAHFIITQPVFDVGRFQLFYERVRPLGVPVLAGLMEIRDARYARFLHNEVPGFFLSPELLERFDSSDRPDEGVILAIEIGRQLRACADGVYLVSSVNQTANLKRIVAGLREG